jgi:hypothetical protein
MGGRKGKISPALDVVDDKEDLDLGWPSPDLEGKKKSIIFYVIRRGKKSKK